MPAPLTCCFTGHRDLPQLLGAQEAPRFAAYVLRFVRELYAQDFRVFWCGMAPGFDLMVSEAVLTLMHEHPERVTLCAALPYPAFGAHLTGTARVIRDRALAACGEHVWIAAERSGYGCYQRRNEHMVDCSSLVIAACARAAGGTWNTIEYALRRARPVVNLLDHEHRLEAARPFVSS